MKELRFIENYSKFYFTPDDNVPVSNYIMCTRHFLVETHKDTIGKIRDYIKYNNRIQKYFFNGQTLENIYISKCGGNFIIVVRNDNLVDITYIMNSKGEILFMMKFDFFHSTVIKHENSYYFAMKNDEGLIIIDSHFNPLFCTYQYIPGDIINGYITLYNDNVHYIVDMNKKIKYKGKYAPCMIPNHNIDNGLFLTLNEDDLYDLVDIETDSILVSDIINDGMGYAIGYGEKVYTEDFDVATISKTPNIHESGIDYDRPISHINASHLHVDELKVYLDSEGNICIAEESKIDTPAIKNVYDFYTGKDLTDEEYDGLGYLKAIKICYKNGGYNIYEKGKGFRYSTQGLVDVFSQLS